MLEAYRAEDSYIVWNNISSHLSNLAVVIADQDYYADFDRCIGNNYCFIVRNLILSFGTFHPFLQNSLKFIQLYLINLTYFPQVCAGGVLRHQGLHLLGPGARGVPPQHAPQVHVLLPRLLVDDQFLLLFPDILTCPGLWCSPAWAGPGTRRSGLRPRGGERRALSGF